MSTENHSRQIAHEHPLAAKADLRKLAVTKGSRWSQLRSAGGGSHAALLERQLATIEIQFAIGRERP